MKNKIEAFLDREEIRDCFDIEFLLRRGVDLPDRTGREWIEAIAEEMIVEPRFQVLNKSFIKILGLMNSDLKELAEMLYQYDRDYVFNSSKFEKAFNFKPTSYKQGIKQILGPGVS